MRATCVRRRRCQAEQSRAAFALVLCCALCVRCVCLSVCLPCLVCFTFILATAGDVPMFPCSTARLFPLRLLILMMTHAFARATHFVVAVVVVVVCLLGYVVIPAPCLSFFLSFCCSCCCFCYCPSIPAVRWFLPPHAAHCCSIFLCHLF